MYNFYCEILNDWSIHQQPLNYLNGTFSKKTKIYIYESFPHENIFSFYRLDRCGERLLHGGINPHHCGNILADKKMLFTLIYTPVIMVHIYILANATQVAYINNHGCTLSFRNFFFFFCIIILSHNDFTFNSLFHFA